MFRYVCKRAGIGEDWTPRELRHSFVSLMPDRGITTEVISRLVGHSSTRTIEVVYRHETLDSNAAPAAKPTDVICAQLAHD